MKWINLTDLQFAHIGSMTISVLIEPCRVYRWFVRQDGEDLASGTTVTLGKAKTAAKEAAKEIIYASHD